MPRANGPDKQPSETNLNRGGRPKGSPNKFTARAKEAFQLAFDELGGVRGLVAWAKKDDEHLTDFYKLYARLIPVEMTGKNGKDLIPADPYSLETVRRLAFALDRAGRSQPTQH